MFTLKVNGMTCGGCARRITAAVLSVDKDAKVDIDLGAKLVHVQTDEDAEAVAGAVTAAGYATSVAHSA